MLWEGQAQVAYAYGFQSGRNREFAQFLVFRINYCPSKNLSFCAALAISATSRAARVSNGAITNFGE